MKTNNFSRIIVAGFLISSVGFGLMGCSKSPADKSPQELKTMFQPPKMPPEAMKKFEESRQKEMEQFAKMKNAAANAPSH